MKIKHCLECGQLLTQENVTTYTCPAGHHYWNNPTGAASVVFKKGDKLLYAVRAHEPGKGKLDIVGGFMEFNESPMTAGIREIKEESGLAIKPADLKLIGAFTNIYTENISSVSLVYLCQNWQGEPVAADDVGGFEWGPPELLISPRFAWQSPDLKEVLNAVQLS